MFDDDISILKKYIALTPLQEALFTEAGILYREWNKKINLISRKDISHLYLHHFLHSLAISKLIEFKDKTKIMDIGTGGGFPGIPLAIMYPESEFVLVDSIGKKIKVIKDLADCLRLKNVVALNSRGESLKIKADFITGRAVSGIAEFYKNVHNLIYHPSRNSIKNGIIYLGGSNMKTELKSFRGKAKSFPISKWFKEEYFMGKELIYIPGR